MAVNVKSIYLLSREVIPHMEKAGARQQSSTPLPDGDWQAARRLPSIVRRKARSCC